MLLLFILLVLRIYVHSVISDHIIFIVSNGGHSDIRLDSVWVFQVLGCLGLGV